MDAMIGGNPNAAAIEMPKYKSHKTVHALEIESCEAPPPGSEGVHLLTFVDKAYTERLVADAVIARHPPEKGDFYVVYDDGYESISPRAPFVEGYAPALGGAAPADIERASAALYKAPRVTLAAMEAAILHRFDVTGSQAAGPRTEGIHQLDILSICILVLRNGFTVIGKAAPASPENFNRGYGIELAYQDAIKQMWPLFGFALKERMAEAEMQADARKETAEPEPVF